MKKEIATSLVKVLKNRYSSDEVSIAIKPSAAYFCVEVLPKNVYILFCASSYGLIAESFNVSMFIDVFNDDNNIPRPRIVFH